MTPFRRSCWGVLVLIIGSAITGCGGAGASDLLSISEEELAAAESHFAPITAEGVAFDQLKESNDQSPEAIRAFVESAYSPDVVFHDETFSDHREGYDQVVSMYGLFFMYFADAQGRDEPTLVGDTTALVMVPFWDMTLGPWTFTESEPLIEVDLIEIADDRVGSLVLYYDLVSLRTTQGESAAFDGSLQERYAAAWASGEDVSSLYSSNASRHDGLAGVDANGSDEITAEAERWSDTIPEATWSLELGFAESSGTQAGAIYAVDYEGCSVTVGVHWDLDDAGLITDELVHYDPATLRTCNWVK